MGAFLLRKLNHGNSIVNTHYLSLINHKSKFLTITRRDSIQIFSVNNDGSLELKAEFPVWENIIDVAPISPVSSPGTWLILLTEQNNVFILRFTENLRSPIVVERFPVNPNSGAIPLTIQPGTLTVTGNKAFSFYTFEGDLCVYKLLEGKDFAHVRSYGKRWHNEGNLQPPVFYALTVAGKFKSRAILKVECLGSHELQSDDNVLSLIYKDDLYQYYSAYLIETEKKVVQLHDLKFPEPLAPISIPIGNIGTLLFGDTGMYLRVYPTAVRRIALSDELSAVKETSLKVSEGGDDFAYIKKGLLGNTWKITSALALKGEQGVDKVLFSDHEGWLHVTTIELEKYLDDFGEIYRVDLKSWKLAKFSKKASYADSLVQLDKNLILLTSKLGGYEVLKVDWYHCDFSLVSRHENPYPILDFNITGTGIPKVQVMGGRDLDCGVIMTSFKGFGIKVDEITLTELNEVVEDFWVFEEFCTIKGLSGIHSAPLPRGTTTIGGQVHSYMRSSFKSHGVENLRGSILDMRMVGRLLYAITDTGIYCDGVLTSSLQISAGEILKDGSTVTVSDGLLSYGNTTQKLAGEVSSLKTIIFQLDLYVVVGYWDGTVELHVKDQTLTLLKLEVPVRSVLMKQVLGKLIVIIGDGNGNVFILSDLNVQHESFQKDLISIGETPVTIVDNKGGKFIAQCVENTVQFIIEDTLSNLKRGYLNLRYPAILKYDSDSSRLFQLDDNKLVALETESESQLVHDKSELPRLVRKSAKFKNYLHLTVFVTMYEKFNKVLSKKVVHSQLEVITNNTFETVSLYKLAPGIEITDIVNTKYRKDLIDTYEEEKIQLAMENVFSQCFVVSCVSSSADDLISPLMLFSIDEDGVIKYQCSAPEAKASFYGLTSHANRLVVGAGNVVGAYKIDYSVADDKFSLKRVADYFESRYFVSHVVSSGPDVIVGDVIEGPRLLKLKVKKDAAEGRTIFKFVEEEQVFSKMHFITALSSWNNFVLVADSLNLVKVYGKVKDQFVDMLSFNLRDRVNVIKGIDTHQISYDLTGGSIARIRSDGEVPPPLTPGFILGTVSGAIFTLSLIEDDIFLSDLKTEQEQVLESTEMVSPLQPNDEYELCRDVSLGVSGYLVDLKVDFIDGDFIYNYGRSDSTRRTIDKYCDITESY